MDSLPLSTTIACIKDLRVQLDKLIKITDSIIPMLPEEKKAAGREVALVKTKLQEARMWAGQSLSHFDTGFTPTDTFEGVSAQ